MKPDAHGEEFAAYVTRRFDPLVRRWSYEVDGVLADAQDVVQKSLIALARKWSDVEDADRWMHRVCERGAAQVVRQRQHPIRGAALLDDDYAASLSAEQDNPAADSDAYRLARELVTGPLEWEVLTLHAEGLTHAQIAKAVQAHPSWSHRRIRCTPANIGNMLRREKERLSREISQRLAAPENDPTTQARMIRREILALPTKQRETFALRLLGLEHAGIAGVMSCQPLTARVNLSHATKKLAEAFDIAQRGNRPILEYVSHNLGQLQLAALLGEALPPLGNGCNSSLAAFPTEIVSTTSAGMAFVVAYDTRGDLEGRVPVADARFQRSLVDAIFDHISQDDDGFRVHLRITGFTPELRIATSAVGRPSDAETSARVQGFARVRRRRG